MVKFEVGKVYAVIWGDSGIVDKYVVTARTAKTITIKPILAESIPSMRTTEIINFNGAKCETIFPDGFSPRMLATHPTNITKEDFRR